MKTMKEKFMACLFYGAIGDALGYEIEFDTLEQVQRRYGKSGIEKLEVNSQGVAIISDDTQMTLFTAYALLVYECEQAKTLYKYMHESYIRWFYTQSKMVPNVRYGVVVEPNYYTLFETADNSYKILEKKELFFPRAPGITCLNALRSGKVGSIEKPLNHSKGCGGVMRVAPIGLYYWYDEVRAFELACEAAVITHGHPLGYLTAGAFAYIISSIIRDNGADEREKLKESCYMCINYLDDISESIELQNILSKAIALSEDKTISVIDAIEQLGEGWIAEEALAIAIYCALREPEIIKALCFSVNHSGDSDSTGSICGNLLGAMYGMKDELEKFGSPLELKEYVKKLSEELYYKSERKGGQDKYL